MIPETELTLRRAIDELEVARAAWIHHCNAPAILAALWDVYCPGKTCSHTIEDYIAVHSRRGVMSAWNPDYKMFTAPGVGATGYSYCTVCGARES